MAYTYTQIHIHAVFAVEGRQCLITRPRRMSSQDLQAVVAAWQSGAISRDTMFELFRSGEILPDGRTNQDEKALIGTEGNKACARKLA